MSTPQPGSDLDLMWREVGRPDATISYLDTGGSGLPVVLLHGLVGHAGEWLGTMRHLFPRYRSLALDQRGHGRSTRRPGDVSREAFADDIAAVCEAAAIDQPVVLIGQSMGAHTVFSTAARYPHLVSHLVMIEGDVGDGVTTPWSHYMMRWRPGPFPSRTISTRWPSSEATPSAGVPGPIASSRVTTDSGRAGTSTSCCR